MTKINNLIILREGERYISPKGHQMKTLVLKCFCGKEFQAHKGNIVRGHTRSCGCLKVPNYHGKTKEPLYAVWIQMHQRCENPDSKYYKNYGLLGVRVCIKWKNFMNFYNWAIANGYKQGLDLDKDKLSPTRPGKMYSPKYCCFITHKENMQHKSTTVYSLHNRESLSIAQLSELYSISYGKLRYRIAQGWDLDKALFTGNWGHKEYKK